MSRDKTVHLGSIQSPELRFSSAGQNILMLKLLFCALQIFIRSIVIKTFGSANTPRVVALYLQTVIIRLDEPRRRGNVGLNFALGVIIKINSWTETHNRTHAHAVHFFGNKLHFRVHVFARERPALLFVNHRDMLCTARLILHLDREHRPLIVHRILI